MRDRQMYVLLTNMSTASDHSRINVIGVILIAIAVIGAAALGGAVDVIEASVAANAAVIR
ncbi:MAG: hypothetical protein EBS76_10315 [Actinobacteria bacterium]|nr:hypothetical protein [Actinomycetota bacterium]